MASTRDRLPDGDDVSVLAGLLDAETRDARALAARRLRTLDRFREAAEAQWGATWTAPDDLAWRDLRAEAAALLGVHELTAQADLDLARRLVGDFSTTLDRLGEGAFSEKHARIVVAESTGLPPELLPVYEARVLPAAAEMLPSRFARFAKEVRAALDPEAMIERHREALEERRITIEAAPDGMAWLGVYGPAEVIVGAAAGVTGYARTLMVEGETRTLRQVEADVMLALLTDGQGVVSPAPGSGAESPVASPAAQRGVRTEVLVHVPVLTAMGADDTPGILDGYGPIDAETARELCATAPGFQRILTHPETGAMLSFGRTTYRVPAELKRYLKVRDETCRFVGCTRNAALCDIDHSTPWAEDGETVEANLAHLCRGHHRLKERKRWRLQHRQPGHLEWTSPTGRTYTTKPASRRFTGAGKKLIAMTEWLPSAPPDDTPPF